MKKGKLIKNTLKTMAAGAVIVLSLSSSVTETRASSTGQRFAGVNADIAQIIEGIDVAGSVQVWSGLETDMPADTVNIANVTVGADTPSETGMTNTTDMADTAETTVTGSVAMATEAVIATEDIVGELITEDVYAVSFPAVEISQVTGTSVSIGTATGAETVTVTELDEDADNADDPEARTDMYCEKVLPVISLAEDERYWLQRLVQAEAGGESYRGKLLVASVIVRRLWSDSFPDTVNGVIWDGTQFESVVNGAIYDNISDPSEETVRAVDEILIDGPITRATYFRTTEAGDNWHKNNLWCLGYEGKHAFFIPFDEL